MFLPIYSPAIVTYSFKKYLLNRILLRLLQEIEGGEGEIIKNRQKRMDMKDIANTLEDIVIDYIGRGGSVGKER